MPEVDLDARLATKWLAQPMRLKIDNLRVDSIGHFSRDGDAQIGQSR